MSGFFYSPNLLGQKIVSAEPKQESKPADASQPKPKVVIADPKADPKIAPPAPKLPTQKSKEKAEDPSVNEVAARFPSMVIRRPKEPEETPPKLGSYNSDSSQSLSANDNSSLSEKTSTSTDMSDPSRSSDRDASSIHSWSDSTSESFITGNISEATLEQHGYVRACRMTEVPNRKGIKVKLPSGTVAVFRQGERMFVMSNSCPHAGFDLSLGDIEDFEGHSCVSCPKHMFKFDLTTGYRVFKGGTTGPLRSKVYHTCIYNDNVYVKIKNPEEKAAKSASKDKEKKEREIMKEKMKRDQAAKTQKKPVK